MNNYFQSHPEMAIFREQGPLYHSLLDRLLGGNQPFGFYARGSNNLLWPPVEEELTNSSTASQITSQGTSQNNESPLSRKGSTTRIEKTPPSEQQRQNAVLIMDTLSALGEQMGQFSASSAVKSAPHSNLQLREQFKPLWMQRTICSRMIGKRMNGYLMQESPQFSSFLTVQYIAGLHKRYQFDWIMDMLRKNCLV